MNNTVFVFAFNVAGISQLEAPSLEITTAVCSECLTLLSRLLLGTALTFDPAFSFV